MIRRRREGRARFAWLLYQRRMLEMALRRDPSDEHVFRTTARTGIKGGRPACQGFRQSQPAFTFLSKFCYLRLGQICRSTALLKQKENILSKRSRGGQESHDSVQEANEKGVSFSASRFLQNLIRVFHSTSYVPFDQVKRVTSTNFAFTKNTWPDATGTRRSYRCAATHRGAVGIGHE